MTTSYSVSKCKYICFCKHMPENLKGIYINSDDLDFESLENKFREFSDNSEDVKDNSDNSDFINIIIDSTIPLFNDICFAVDEKKVEMNSATLKQDILAGGSLGSSQMLEAIASNKFVINAGRKGANISSVHINQNHDAIDAIASNGLLNSPTVLAANSVGKLLLLISKYFQSFKIYITSPYLKVDKFDGTVPSTYCVPRYAVGHGEILSVFFRYITLLFFGYSSVNTIGDSLDHERMYDI